MNVDETMDYVERLVKLAHKYRIHELHIDGVHLALTPMPETQPQPVENPAGPLPAVPGNIGPSDEELLYWSAGGVRKSPAPKSDDLPPFARK